MNDDGMTGQNIGMTIYVSAIFKNNKFYQYYEGNVNINMRWFIFDVITVLWKFVLLTDNIENKSFNAIVNNKNRRKKSVQNRDYAP